MWEHQKDLKACFHFLSWCRSRALQAVWYLYTQAFQTILVVVVILQRYDFKFQSSYTIQFKCVLCISYGCIYLIKNTVKINIVIYYYNLKSDSLYFKMKFTSVMIVLRAVRWHIALRVSRVRNPARGSFPIRFLSALHCLYLFISAMAKLNVFSYIYMLILCSRNI